MALDVNVKIQLSKPIGKVGSWYPLLCVVDSDAAANVYAEYTSLDEMAKADASYKLLASQPSDWSTDYAKYYKKENGVYVNLTSAETFAQNTFYQGLKTAPSGSVYQAATLMLMQDNAPAKFAVLVLTTFATTGITPYLTKGWRQLVFVDGSAANQATLATFIETTDKMLFLTVSTTAALATLYGTISEYDRTVVMYHKNATDYPNAVAALVGATAGYEAGSFTYKNIKLKGVAALVIPNDITEASLISDVHEKGALTVLEKAGDIVTSEGKVASGEFADIIDCKDYIVQNIEYSVQKVFNNNTKVPYTNAGISMLEAATLGVLVNAYNNGMIAEGDDGKPDYSVNFALRSETSAENRANRYYPYGQFSLSLAGAIHSAEIIGEITV